MVLSWKTTIALTTIDLLGYVCVDGLSLPAAGLWGFVVRLDRLYSEYVSHRPALKERSAEQLRLAVRSFEVYLGRPARIGDLTDSTLAKFMRAYLAEHAAATTNSKRRGLLTLARWALKRGSSPSPLAEVPAVPEPRRVPQAWTVCEIEKLVSCARECPGMIGDIPARLFWPSLILATFDTGCRVSALMSARSMNLSMAERSLVIEPEATKTGVGAVYWLHDQTVASLAGHYDPTRELVWPWPYHRNTLWSMSRRIVEKAGLTVDRRGRGQFHRIRRTTISYCAAVSPSLAQQQAGHGNPRTTDRYIDPRIARRRSAVDVLPRPRL